MHTVEYYPVIKKKNKLLMRVVTDDFQTIMLSERAWFMCILGPGKFNLWLKEKFSISIALGEWGQV